MSRRKRRPRYASKKRLKALRSILTDAIDLADRVVVLTPHDSTGELARAYLAACVEAGHGVLSEVDARRSLNAIRLARHIYEYELHLDYALDRPKIRLLQIRADDAHKRLLATELVAGLRLRPKAAKSFQEIVDRAKQEAKSRGWTKKGRSAPEDGPFLPRLLQMAEVLDRSRQPGRKENYDLVYRGASSMAHPTLLAADAYIEVLDDGSTAIRSLVEDPVREVLALVTATLSLINVVDTTNWRLSGTVGGECRALLDRLRDT